MVKLIFGEFIEVVLDEGGVAQQMIHGDVKEALNLRGVEIHSQDPVCTGGGDHIGDELCGDGIAALGFAVLPCITKVGNDSGNTTGRGAAAGIDHNQQLHQMVIDGLAGGLNEKNVSATDGFFQGYGSLTVSECTNGTLTQLDSKLLADRLGKGGVGVAAKYLDVITVCNHQNIPRLFLFWA